MRWCTWLLLPGLLAAGCAKPHPRPLLQKERVIAAVDRLGGRYRGLLFVGCPRKKMTILPWTVRCKPTARRGHFP